MTVTPRNLEVVHAPGGYLRRPNYVESVVLVANASQQVAIPPTATFCDFSATVDFFAAYGANPVAAIPVASSTDGGGSELNPLNRFFGRGEDAFIALISGQAGIVTINFWGS